MGRLDELDLSLDLSKDEAAARLKAAQERLLAVRLALGGKLDGEDGRIGPPVCVLFEGWDASGKGGALKRLVEPLDPRHVRVAQFAAPTPDEKRHHFLWRFWPKLPGWGGMSVFDRSWYGRVLVERVEGFATQEEWERAYDEIVGLERSLADEGMILVKFWLHISDEEQLKRFKAREKDPLKAWKLTPDDWRNREKRRGVHPGRGGHAGPHEPAVRTLAAGGGGLEALGPREGGGDRGEPRSRRAARRAGSSCPLACPSVERLPAKRVRSGSRSPRRTWRSTSTQSIPRDSARTRAWGLIDCAARIPRQRPKLGSVQIRSR